MNRRVLYLVVVMVLTVGLVGVALTLLARAPQPLPPATPTPEDVPIATVNGEVIGFRYWVEQCLLDQVMSRLAGRASPPPRETLDRLINEALLLQAYPPAESPTDEAVTQRIRELEGGWGIAPATLDAHLQAAGLSRQVLRRTVRHLLMVEAAQRQLPPDVEPTQWVKRARQEAEIWVDEARLAQTRIPIVPLPTLTAVP